MSDNAGFASSPRRFYEMSFTVTVMPSGKQFAVEPEETVLEAGLRQGVVLPYGCKNGACGSCKAKVVEGRVEQGLALELNTLGSSDDRLRRLLGAASMVASSDGLLHTS